MNLGTFALRKLSIVVAAFTFYALPSATLGNPNYPVDNATDPNPLVPRPIETIKVPVSSPTTNQPNLTSCQTDLKAALAHIDRLSRVRAEEAKTIETLKAQNSKLQTLVENLIRKIRICQENPAACKNLEIP
jgi:hypothetical protein